MNDPKDETINSTTNEDIEDVEDMAAFDERADEPDLQFDDIVEDLRRRGKI